MNQEKFNLKLLRLVDTNYEYLEQCANETIVAVNKLLGQMHYYHSLSMLYDILNKSEKKSDK